MWQPFRIGSTEKLIAAPNRRLVALRIEVRVFLLRGKFWWSRPKATVFRHHWPKPVALLLVGIFGPVLVGWLLSLMFPQEAAGLSAAVHNLLTDPEASPLQWREATQLLLLLIGVPAAFLLWLFRDINVSGTLESQRKDVNLKEFHEIQMRAAGAMDEKLPAQARETLQIAAMHQLRAFLRGEYGASFRRPAFELLRARLVASAEATGTQAIEEWLIRWRNKPETTAVVRRKEIEEMTNAVDKAVGELRANRVADAEKTIVQEEWGAIFRSGLPLAGSTFDRIYLEEAILSEIDLRDCRFIDAYIYRTHFEQTNLAGTNFAGAVLFGSYFDRAFLFGARFEGASLVDTHLDLAWLSKAHFEGANLSGASLRWADLTHSCLDGADLRYADLTGADFRGATLIGTNLSHAQLDQANLDDATLSQSILRGADPAQIASCDNASFDGDTEFADDWSELSEEKRNEARKPWADRGAKPVH